MTVVYSDPQASVPVLGSPWPAGDDARLRHAVRRAATVPLALCLVVWWVDLVSWGLPETRGLPALGWWLTQLAPLGPLRGHALGAVLLLLSAIALFALSRTSHWVGRAAMSLPALLGSVTSAVVLVRLLVSGTLGASAVGTIAMVVWVLAAWYAAIHALLVDLGPGAAPDRRTGLPLLIVWTLLLPGPLSLGRLLLAHDLRTEAILLADNTVALKLAALLTGASAQLLLFGVVLGVVVWLGYQCWPRPAARRSWRWYVALAAALLVLTQVWWSAQTSSAHRVTQLELGTPTDDLHFTCGTWVYPPAPGTPADTPTVTVAASGLGCHVVTTYVGYRQLGTTTSTVSVSPVALRAPTASGATGTGTDSTRTGGIAASGSTPPATTVPLVGARYGDVLVLAGSNRIDRVADALVAIPMRGGEPLWTFSCGRKGEVRARFPGGRTNPAENTVQAGAPGPVVVFTCGAERLRRNPVTGLSG